MRPLVLFALIYSISIITTLGDQIKPEDLVIQKLSDFLTQNKGFLKSQSPRDKDHNSPLCSTCKILFKQVLNIFLTLPLDDKLIQLGQKVCDMVVNYNYLTCRQGVQDFLNIGASSVFRHIFDPDWACLNLKACDYPFLVKENFTQWAIDTLQDKPKGGVPTPSSSNSFKFLSLNDIHIDLKYKEGSESQCSYPICCRDENTNYSKVEAPAKHWGMHSCDIPYNLFDETLKHISETQPDIDFIIFLGDYAPHDVTAPDYKSEVEMTYIHMDIAMKKYFWDNQKNQPKIPIIITLGNHESVPIDQLNYNDDAGQND